MTCSQFGADARVYCVPVPRCRASSASRAVGPAVCVAPTSSRVVVSMCPMASCAGRPVLCIFSTFGFVWLKFLPIWVVCGKVSLSFQFTFSWIPKEVEHFLHVYGLVVFPGPRIAFARLSLFFLQGCLPLSYHRTGAHVSWTLTFCRVHVAAGPSPSLPCPSWF